MFWFGLLFMAFILYSPGRPRRPRRRACWTHYAKLRGWFTAEAAAMTARVRSALGRAGAGLPAARARGRAAAILACTGVIKRFGAFTAVDGASLGVCRSRGCTR